VNAAMPSGLKFAVTAVIMLACGGAAYLMVERGPALMLDLTDAIAACF
jgi:hypothetical protein